MKLILWICLILLAIPPATDAKIEGWDEDEMELMFNYFDPTQTGQVNLQAWFQLANELKQNKLDATVPPTDDDDVDLGYDVGSIWVDIAAENGYLCLNNSDGAAVWLDLGSGTVVDATAVHTDGASEFAGITTEETSPSSDDLLLLEKSSDGTKRKLQIANLPAGIPTTIGQEDSTISFIDSGAGTRSDKMDNTEVARYTVKGPQFGPQACEESDLDADDTFCSQRSRVGIAAVALSPWDTVYKSPSTDEYGLAGATLATRPVGIAVRVENDVNSNGSIDIGDTFLIMIEGIGRNDQWTGLSPDKPICQAESAGDLVDCDDATICSADNDVGIHVGDTYSSGTIVHFDFTKEPVVCNGN